MREPISKRGCSGFVCWPSSGSALALRTNDQMLEAKKQLAGDFLGGGAEMLLTEMKDAALLRLVALDLGAAMEG